MPSLISFLVLVHWHNNLETDLSLYSVRGAIARSTDTYLVDCVLDHRSSQTQDFNIYIFCLPGKQKKNIKE